LATVVLPVPGRPRQQQAGGGLDPEPARRLGILNDRLQLFELSLRRLGQDERVPRPVLDQRAILAAERLDGR
jgi:hypothetical protein